MCFSAPQTSLPVHAAVRPREQHLADAGEIGGLREHESDGPFRAPLAHGECSVHVAAGHDRKLCLVDPRVGLTIELVTIEDLDAVDEVLLARWRPLGFTRAWPSSRDGCSTRMPSVRQRA